MICQGDNVKIITQNGIIANGIVTSKRYGLITVYIPPGSAGFGIYKDWTGTDFFLTKHLQVLESFSNRPRGKPITSPAHESRIQ